MRLSAQEPLGPAYAMARRVLQAVESALDRVFGAGCNPWRHLGALSFLLFWVITATGIYVYIAFDTSVGGAYASVEQLSQNRRYLGGIMRSLHRYASDAFVVTVLLHLAKEFINSRYRTFRWFSWVSGVPLLWLMYASGIGGYWLVWDELAQFSLTATAEWLDALPLAGGALARNFLSVDGVSDRLFSLLMFFHIGIPLLLLLGMWVHIQRISHADTNPAPALGACTLLILVLLSLIAPATSQAPADLAAVPAQLALDWFYLFIHPLMYESSPAALWALALGLTALLVALPWSHRWPRPIARVDLDNCNGCGRCAMDCPYEAVVLRPRSDGRPFRIEATVVAENCAGCGICAGACPSSTPFRHSSAMVSGIEMPQQSIVALRLQVDQSLARLSGDANVVIFGCDHAAQLDALAGSDTAVFSLLCIGMLPPAFIEYALRGGADGVLVTGCRSDDCAFRLGNHLIKARIEGAREPHLRQNIPRDRVRIVWGAQGDFQQLKNELGRFRSTLISLARDRRRGRTKV